MITREYFRVSRMMGFGARAEFTLVALLIVAAAFEGIGITMLLPIVDFIQSGGDVEALTAESGLWDWLVRAYGAVGVPITLATLVITSFVSILARQMVAYIRQVYFATLREDLIRQVRNLCFLRYLEADAAYHDRESAGAVVNSLSTELYLAINAIMAPVQVLSYAFMTLFYFGLILMIGGPVTVAALVIIGLSAFALKRLLERTFTSGKNVADANEKMSAFLVERLGSVRLVRLSGTEDAEMADMRRFTQRLRDSMVSMRIYLSRVDVMIEPIAIGIGFIVLYFGVQFFNLGIEEIGVVVLVAMMRLLPAFKEVLRTWQASLGYFASLQKLTRRLDNMAAAREHRGGDHPFAGLKEVIRFDDIHFRYEPATENPALNGVNLDVKANETTAIVGPSGAGKSTLIDLLPRLRDPTQGIILVDGQPLREFSVKSLRGGIAYMSQFPLVFNVSIAQHIRFGKPQASDAEIREATELAGAAEFIDALPQGYDTLLGEDGVRLSGGQRQRVDLARALVRKAPILILDEPTSDLDAEAEARFRATLERIRKTIGSTIIIVAHRLSTVAKSDNIVVLEDGQVTATGSHAELMAAGGWYAKAFRKQQSELGEERHSARPHPVLAS